MGTFEKSFIVDGQEYELYATSDEESTGYQLVDHAGQPVGEPLSELPDEEAVLALVAARRLRAA